MPYYRSGEVRLHYTSEGDGTPCLFIHGSYVDGTFWKKQIEDFKKDFKIIVPDLRGHGLSERPKGEYTPQVMAQDIYDLIRELGIKKTSIVGHSLGSRIALQYAVTYPKTLERLVLANGSGEPIIHSVRLQRYPKHIIEEFGIGTPHFDLKKYNDYEVLRSFANPDLDEVDWLCELMRNTPDYVKYGVGKYFAPLDLSSRYNEIKVPSMVIVGEQDVISPVGDVENMARLIPDCRLVIIPDSGHALPLEKPQEFNENVLSFLSTSSKR